MTIAREEITGVVLAGERSGVDKGLQNHAGMPLALHVLLRLSQQVGEVLVHANRNLAPYEAMGAPVWPDPLPDLPAPLAGLLTGLERCETPWLASVPCDAPDFPEDLVERLAAALLREGADIAVAATRGPDGLQRHPAFCLLKAGVAESLGAFLRQGGREADEWFARHGVAEVTFDDPALFG